MTCLCSPSIRVRYSLMETGTLWWFSFRKKPASMAESARLPRHEHELLEQVHVLLVLQERAVERRDDGLALVRAQRLGRKVLGEQELQPVEQLRGRRLLLES